MSLCKRLGNVDNSCSGVGCTIPSFNNHSGIWNFNPCGYAFIAEQGHFNFSCASFDELNNTEQIPLDC
ncbi:hypothetical protein RchiOBHm_Chr5g0017001 [Rosa chinensis]|uniref:Uncharacterized protein n=1 Tax=Rosa chinensis TaxID=74649 RepID=A0A2P6Q6D5_ROSCH|nr:hypothetical protein RchiOBHm_Chr5g0017001 [Rosa chinensis]